MDDGDVIRAVHELSYRRLVTQMVALRNRSETGDVVQESFLTESVLTALTDRRDITPAGNEEAWLRTMALNVLRNRWRRARVSARTLPKFRGELGVLDRGAPVPEDPLAVVNALSQPSLLVRVPVVLHHVGDLSVARIAHERCVGAGTGRTRLAPARAKIAGQLSDHEGADHV